MPTKVGSGVSATDGRLQRFVVVGLAAVAVALVTALSADATLGQSPPATTAPEASAGAGESPTPGSPEPTPASTPEPGASTDADVSPEPSERPKPFAEETETLTGFNDLLAAFAAVVITLALWALAALLAWLLVPRLLELLNRQRELIVPEFVNGTANEDVGKLLVGENVRLRETLAKELEQTRRKIEVSRRYTDHAPAQDGRPEPITKKTSATQLLNVNAPPAERVPLPAANLDPRVGELVAALSAAVPETIKPLFGLLAFAFPPRGVQITSTVQRQPGPPDRLGFSVEITDLGKAPASKPVTWWEDEPKEASPADTGRDRAAGPLDALETRRELNRVVDALEPAGKYAEALRFAERAAQLEPSNRALAARADRIATMLSRQGQARARFEAATHLASAGDRAAAVREHAAAFRVSVRPVVTRAWRVVLGLQRGSVATSRRNLGVRYASSVPLLVPEGLGLLEEAEQAGSAGATKKLKDLRTELGRYLATAALSLSRLGHAEDARSLAEEAAELDPEGEETKRAVAAVEPTSPSDEDKAEAKARALCELARIFEDRGAWSNARENYEAALGENPELAEARLGLARVIAEQRDTSQRLTPLLGRAAKWAAYTLVERDWLTRIDKGSAGAKQRALIHNYFGMLYASEGWSGSREWLSLASFELRTAIELDPTFYQAEQNLGETLAIRARYSEPALAQRLHREAMLHYGAALTLLAASPDDASTRAARRIKIEQALSLLLMSPKEAAVVAESRKLLQEATAAWTPTLAVESGTAYDLACWHALASKGRVPDGSQDEAIRQLAIAVALDPAWSYAALNDPDLASVQKTVPRALNLIAAGRASFATDVPGQLELAEAVAESLKEGGRNVG